MFSAIKARTVFGRFLPRWPATLARDLLWGLAVSGSDGRICCEEGEAACPECRARREAETRAKSTKISDESSGQG